MKLVTWPQYKITRVAMEEFENGTLQTGDNFLEIENDCRCIAVIASSACTMAVFATGN